jgi:hypothetical protein
MFTELDWETIGAAILAFGGAAALIWSDIGAASVSRGGAPAFRRPDDPSRQRGAAFARSATTHTTPFGYIFLIFD